MYETVLNHSGNWKRAKTTHIVCKIAGEDSPIKLTNDPKGAGNKHAEKKLIKKLKEKIKAKKKGKRLEITIYINNSPCSDSKHKCTEKLINFLEKNKHVRLKMFVANLYNIRRESCKDEKHYKLVNPDVHKANYKGLKKLMQHDRCEIMAFTKDVWEELLNFVTVSDECKKQLLREYCNEMDGNDRSREEKDRRIQEDLDNI